MGGIPASGGPGPAPRRFRLASPVTATVLGGLVLVLVAAALVLRPWSVSGRSGARGRCPPVLVYAAVGFVVARRQPGNPIGWILSGFVMFLLSSDVGLYAVLDYRFGHRGFRWPRLPSCSQPLWAPALLLFPVVILLFPDGRLAARRWRWVLWAYVVAGALASAALFSPAVTAVARHDVRLDAFGDVISTGRSHGGPLAVAEVLGLLFDPVIWLSFVAHQVL